MKRQIPSDRLQLLALPSDQGLSEEQVASNRQRFGNNRIAERPPRSPAATIRDAAGDPMLWFLLSTSALFSLLGQITDAIVLAIAIAPLLAMDFILHYRTQASIEGLGTVLAQEATVRRDGVVLRVSADQIVPGDLGIVAAGEFFPADGVIVAGNGLQVEESSLTGEAFPVAKHVCPASAAPQDEAWAFAGTRLLTGTAHVRMLLVGGDSLYGEVVRSVVKGPRGRTRLQNAVAGLVRTLVLLAAAFCVLLAAVRLWQGFGLADAFLSAATLAVAAIPEEFPVALTFFLAVGVYRLAKRRALVRRAVAVENIGRTSAICSDKTGTITEGRLTFHHAMAAPGVSEEALKSIAALAARSESGDPLDVAIVSSAQSNDPAWRRARVFPFTEDRRRETSLSARPDRTWLLATKGAPETVLAFCDIQPLERQRWLEHVRLFSAQGSKVIAVAWLESKREPPSEPDSGFRSAGLIAVTDPIRPGVAEAMAQARLAGIQVVMVTGDHPDTAAAIARECGLTSEPLPICGDQLEETLSRMDETELRQLSVIARANPAQKVMVVRALQRSGRTVAVTGDGVNDAPALRAADIGIAMGLRGTRTAREVSQIVLMDDKFSTIIDAIKEGRQLFHNLRLSFAFLLTIHGPLVASAAIIPLLGFPLLYLPIHVVWLELLIHPAAMLGFQQPAGEMTGEHPGDPKMFFSALDWKIIAATSGIITVAVLGAFLIAAGTGETTEHARAMALVVLGSGPIKLLAGMKID